MTVHGAHLNGGTVYIDGAPVQTSDCHASGPGGRGPADLCFVTPPHAPGLASVMVRLANGQHSNTVRFGYDKTPPPVINRLNPAQGSDNGGTPVVVSGDSLDVGTVFVDGSAVPTAECHRTTKSVSLCFTTPPHAPGLTAVTVHTPDGAVSNSVRFKYTSTPAPRIARLSPATGPDNGGTPVRVSGTNLDQGVVLVDGNRVATVQCAPGSGRRSPGVELCFTTPPHRAGHAEVTVATPNGKVSNRVPFAYTNTPAPQIRRLNPTHGPDVGGDRVQVEGDNLDQGVVRVDGTAVATEPCPVPHSRRTGLCFTTPPHRAGHAEITVATPNGKVSNAVPYVYDDTPPPFISSLRPRSVSPAGGAEVTIVGDRIAQGTAYLDGHAVASTPCSLSATSFSGTHESLCFVAPPHPAGIASVVVHNPNGKVSNEVHLPYR